MSDRFDDLAMSLASEGTVGRRSMIRGALAAVGLGAGAVVAGTRPAAAAPGAKPVSCPPGLTSCNGLCRDLTSNVEHCGACGTVCGLDSVCRNGLCVKVACTCEPTCPTGLTWCGTCVDPSADAAHCGACGSPCASGQVCSNGACVQCAQDGQCPPGDECGTYVCSNGTCVRQNQPNGITCAGGNGTCVDGICTNNCPGVDLMTDVNNCGTCGYVCPSANSTPMCTSGTCGYGICNPGFVDCDPNQPGCETDSTTDFNCGGCGVVCGPGTTCASGFCVCGPQLATCQELSVECGIWDPNGCGQIDCGTCADGLICVSGHCVS